ncbi:hypothetical protein TNCT_359141 [Trichonephila clavata]|uniref:DUF382 domain-containing protein n=1 Tax=Trichonephila clavata TaxID=2740835 RepID=A0A8X6J826_TRICU|nr:hypothetical protein TNCT_359141 [Trichonephila clavata]
MGQALRERDDQKTMKAKMWKKVRLKLRKSHIDYQKLGNSVSKWRAKPKVTIYGDFGYEGKAPLVHCGIEERWRGGKCGSLPPNLWTAAEEKFRDETRTGGP